MHLQSKNSFHDEFLQDDFSVDAFLQNYSGTYTLEGLRDALSLHLKSLESRMIDIVNSESDTILSLSSSLNGLDDKIDNLRSSLEQLKEEVMSVLRIIEYNLKTVKNLLESKKNINIEKRNYINVIQAMVCCERVKKILESDSYSKPLQSDILLRAVDQYLLQETHLSQCDQNLLSDVEKNDIAIVKRLVYKNYKNSFLDAFKKKKSEEILRLLQIGVFLRNQKDTEQLIRQKIVSLKLNDLINEKAFTQKGLVNLYEDISKFITEDLELILSLTSVMNRNNGIVGYNFFINSVWIDIEEKLRINLSSIFAPGNPLVFQNRFIQTMNFFTNLSKKWESNNETIFNHSSYEVHMKRWNLPVYFQICFNDIVLPYERVLVEENLSNMYADKSNDFKLSATSSAFRSINRCLEPDIYIQQIVHKFWKLVLQIISRYNVWVTFQLALYKNIKIEEDLSTFDEKVKFLTYLQYDVKLLSMKIKEINTTIFPQEILNIITENVKTCSERLLEKLTEVEAIISIFLSAQSIFALKQVSNIPRLYRKTNRTVPTEPAQYVYKVLITPQTFVKNYRDLFPKTTFELILTNIYEKITNEYVNVVDEILTQVRKTEDSLRRLKKIRQSQTVDASVIGDDQKIRIQLQLDVNYYCSEVRKTSNNVNLSALIMLVKDTN